MKSLAELPREHRAAGLRPHIVGFGSSLPAELQAFSNDVAAFWTNQANKIGVQVTPTTVQIIDRAPAKCGNVVVTTNDQASYCFVTNSVLLPVANLDKTYKAIGNAAVAEIVGDLYGLHIAELLGFYSLKGAGKLTQTDIWKSGVCFSGAWMYTVWARKLFRTADLRALGRELALYVGPGTTDQQWVDTFNAGFEAGDPTKCIPSAAR